MFENTINTNFISEKVAKIRFCPETYSEATGFVTGSYHVKNNSVKFWNMERSNEFVDDNIEYVPKTTATVPMDADITGMEFLDFNNFGVTTSDGTFTLIYINRDRDENNLKENFKYNKLHEVSCNGLSLFDEDVVTIGEFGDWNIVSTQVQKVVRCNKEADSCCLTAVSFVNRKELITGNNMGILKIFDTLQTTDKAVHNLMVSCEDEKQCNRITCITYHPTQQFQCIVGTEEGSITVFDLRKPNIPASYLSAHTEPINEINFHRTDPTKLFTAAENGDLWLWSEITQPIIGFVQKETSTEAPWLNGERAKNSIDVTSLIDGRGMGINSFDTFRNKIIAAGDNEAVYLVDQMY